MPGARAGTGRGDARDGAGDRAGLGARDRGRSAPPGRERAGLVSHAEQGLVVAMMRGPARSRRPRWRGTPRCRAVRVVGVLADPVHDGGQRVLVVVHGAAFLGAQSGRARMILRGRLDHGLGLRWSGLWSGPALPHLGALYALVSPLTWASPDWGWLALRWVSGCVAEADAAADACLHLGVANAADGAAGCAHGCPWGHLSGEGVEWFESCLQHEGEGF